jgi:hypothetical protein
LRGSNKKYIDIFSKQLFGLCKDTKKKKNEKPALYETNNRGVVDSPPMLLAKLYLFLVHLKSDEIDITGFYEIVIYYYQIAWHGLRNEN